MSHKQEIYRDILSWALPSARNTFSWYRQIRPIVVLWPKTQRYLAAQYRLAEFVHNLYVSILDEEFTDHDIHLGVTQLVNHARKQVAPDTALRCRGPLAYARGSWV